MGKKQPIHRTTRFDFDCEAKLEYDKKYGRNLSYGYYSLYKETGRLPLEWLIRLIDLEKAIPKNFTLASMEHQEYKRRYHKKIGFKEYVENKKAKKLSNEWLKYLEESKKWIPKDHIFDKPTFGSVLLAEKLRDLSRQEEIEVELTGLCTDICVVSNALLLKAYMPEVAISVDSACCAGVTPEKHRAALETMASCQIIIE